MKINKYIHERKKKKKKRKKKKRGGGGGGGGGEVVRVINFIRFLILTLLVLKDVPLVEFMCLVFTRMPVRVTVGDSGLCCCTCVAYFER